MPEHLPPSKDQTSDEIDLGQLLTLIKRGFKSLGNVVLRIFLFFKKYALILLGLALLGVAISFGLNQVVSKKQKIEAIVRPNLDSKDYLYDVVAELNANIRSKNEEFFTTLGLNIGDLKGFRIEIEPIEQEEEDNEKVLNEMKYLETLTKFGDQNFVLDILKTELAERSVVDHKLSFFYINREQGLDVVKKLIKYINTNKYFNTLKEISIQNAESRIENNRKLIRQIDDLVQNYSNSLALETSKSESGGLYFEKESALDIPSLLSLKNNLIKEIEEKNLEIKQQSSFVNVINLGSTQEVKKPFLSNRMFIIPLFLILGFLFYVFMKYLNAKAKELT